MRSDRKPPLFPDAAKDVHDELAAHIELRRQELVTQGMSEDAARVAAERRFGDVPAIARECRDIDERHLRQRRRTRMWTDLRQDVGYAFRLLRRAPGFTTAAVVTLGLGLGATTAIFSLANWTLLRPIAGVERSGELLQIWSGIRPGPTSFQPSRVSYPNLADIAPRLRTVDLAGQQWSGPNVSTTAQPARAVDGNFVSPDYFRVLGVRFAAGRPFTPDEDRPGADARVAVVSAAFARTMFGSEAAALAQVLHVNGLPFTVVGVPEGGFQGTDRVRRVDLWLPATSTPVVEHMPDLRFDERDGGGFYEFIGRPREGATPELIQQELNRIAAWLVEQHPKENEKFAKAGFHVLAPAGSNPLMRPGMVRTVLLMLAMSALVLLIACSNVANLLLMRGIGREGEAAMRTALGAGRLRLLRQHLTEGLLLWMLGGVAAVGFAWAALQLVEGGALLGLTRDVEQVPLDWRVIAFAASLSLVFGVLFSLMPAIRASRMEPIEALKQGSASSAPRNLRIGSALSIVQLALSLTLVVGALLLAVTGRSLTGVDVGFDPGGLYVFYVRPSSIGYTSERAEAYRDEFSRRLSLSAGVAQVSVSTRAPFSGSQMFTRVRAAGVESYTRSASNEIITPNYFETLGIPTLKGRVFSDQDLGTGPDSPRPVVVLGALLAESLFGSQDPIGRRIEFGVRGLAGKPFEVIGVVGDVRLRSLTEPMDLIVYHAAGIDGRPPRGDAMFLVRARDGADIRAMVREIAAALEPSLPVVRLTSMTAAVAEARAELARLSHLFTMLAVVAGVLAGVGLYAVVSFGVAARRREFGIRLALGAAPKRMMTLVLRRTALITGSGLVLGLGGAILLTRGIESRLFGVTRFDPVVWTLAALVLVVVALAASWIPARRAVRVPVTDALRTL